MQNMSFIRIKPVITIHRKCNTIKRLYEVADTMKQPVVIFESNGNYLKVTALNLFGCCYYTYESFHYDPFGISKEDAIMLNASLDISQKLKSQLPTKES